MKFQQPLLKTASPVSLFGYEQHAVRLDRERPRQTVLLLVRAACLVPFDVGRLLCRFSIAAIVLSVGQLVLVAIAQYLRRDAIREVEELLDKL